MIATLLVGLGGALGSIARYWLSQWGAPISRSLPWATILINVAGSGAIGFVGTLLAQGRQDPARLFLMAGLCGGFTTFSAFSLQTLDLLRAGAAARAALNVALAVLLCVTAAAIGQQAAASLHPQS